MAERSHLSIGEVLSLLREEFPDVTISKIRFLESQGLVDPERTPSGYRKFYEHDVERLRWILRQQRENFLPLKVIRGRLSERGEPDEGSRDPWGEHGGSAPAAERPGGAGEEVAARAARPARASSGRTGRSPTATPSLFSDARLAAVLADEPEVSDEPVTGQAQPAQRGALPADRGQADRGQAGAGRPQRERFEHGRPEPGQAEPRQAERRQAAWQADPGQPVPGQLPPPSGAAGVPATPQLPAPESASPSPPDDAPPARAETHRPGTGAPTGRPAAEGAPDASGRPGSAGEDSDSYTTEELAATAGTTTALVHALEQYGLISARAVVAGEMYFDAGAVSVTRVASEFARHGVEARHLRAWRNAADREAALFEQIVLPLLRQRNPQSRRAAVETLAGLAKLGGELRSALVDHAIREIR